jgi:hypothetical protein
MYVFTIYTYKIGVELFSNYSTKDFDFYFYKALPAKVENNSLISFLKWGFLKRFLKWHHVVAISHMAIHVVNK